MKKSEFYIHRVVPTDGFEKVSGFVGTFKGVNGEELELGFDKRAESFPEHQWAVTELSTGLKVNAYGTIIRAEQAMTPEYVSLIYSFVDGQHNYRVRQMDEFLESIGWEKNGK